MISSIEHSSMLTILYWLAMLPIAVFILVRVTAFFAEDWPGTFFEALRTLVLMGAVVWFTYDFSGYLLACLMQTPQLGVAFPPNYHYWDWIREPMSLKWQVLGFVPMIRYVPLVVALVAGGMVQVALWRIPFRAGLIVFVTQIVLDLFAMAMLSLVFSFFVGVQEANNPGAAARMRQDVGATRSNEPPGSLPDMQARIERLGMEEGPAVRRLWSRWEGWNRRLQPFYDFVRPVTRHFPLPVQNFFDGGGWLLALTGLVALVQFRPRRRRSAAA